MPTYEFRCRACGDTFTVVRPMAESGAPAACPEGHDDTVRLLGISAVGGATRTDARPGSGASGGGCCGGACGCG